MLSAEWAGGTQHAALFTQHFVYTGGMGAVFRARDPRLGREVALKILPAELARGELIERFGWRRAATGRGSGEPLR